MLHAVTYDERPLMQYAMGVLLDAESDIEVIGSAQDIDSAIELVETLKPDVLVAGRDLAGASPLTLLNALAERVPGSTTQVVVYVGLGDEETIYDLLDCGARALLTEDSDWAGLALAVRAAAAGEAMLAPRIAYWLIDCCLKNRRPTRLTDDNGGVANLTPREREILILTARGWSTDDIAANLFIGEATVRTHVYRLRSKLQLRDRAQIVSYTYQNGLLEA